MNIDDVRAALSAGDLEALIGLEECGWMDVKSRPYMVGKGAHHKEELVKDVAGFANTVTGGLLIIGFKATAANGVETISEVSAVPRTLVDTETYRKLIDDRVYPHIEGLELRWTERSEGKGVLSIDIPAQPASARPFVIPAPTGKDAKSVTGLAVPVRRGDQTVFWSAPEAHRRLSAGWMAIGSPAADDGGAYRDSVPPAEDAADRSKAQRILAAMPFDAPWLRFLQSRPPMPRVKVEFSQAIHQARDDLRADDIGFLAPALVHAHAAFMNSLDRLVNELDDMHDPDDGPNPPTYAEVPPEWKHNDPERYKQAMADLSEARDAFLEARTELVNVLNRRGLLLE
ncbi:helix-turn-helix domain-containing protein [Streptomyces sp. NPDC048473]|uniref:AlbA family DNA-binding domain-containing protein n=1 Tax=Streptomyces sp. NPDC048473 TaxID=3365556 RepID=UPI00371796DA